MLVDAVVSLGYVSLRSLFVGGSNLSLPGFLDSIHQSSLWKFLVGSRARYALLQRPDDDDSTDDEGDVSEQQSEQDEEDAPDDQRISNRTVAIGLLLSIALCIITIHTVFGALVPLYATVIAVFMALVLSIMGVRALGETDLNPVSGISKLAQLFFALIIPQSNKSSVLINLVAGAVSEAGALQAGDLMQDLKTGHLLGASPKAQFWGQMIGATAGAVLSAFIYRLYTRVYEIPGDLFQVPTATLAVGNPWRPWIPGGMYNVPSFTLARAAGGIMAWVWLHVMKRSSTPLIILASGFILGEGFLSIVNLIMEALSVPHF
ncbi:oligonucleotide transporter [Cordyceps javanica]|uniref:Oligonucleotide transporter n=1 Tax=Cordyceps javanica TaxID=43265 RepID=A0A545VND5_9HYPO|nr:oligonucleotide transporter [Cordyceps javanica]TQW03241.1 oligonucleotide transporter [Cordyceps javanica]